MSNHSTDNSSGSKTKDVNSLDLDSLIELLSIAYGLKQAFAKGEHISEIQLANNLPLLKVLFEYLLANLQKQEVDISLLKFLEKLLGMSKKKSLDEKDNSIELENEDEHSLTEEEKKRRLRLAMYEIYKITNPRRIAGETAEQNFYNNLETKGLKEALQNEGAEFAKNLSLKQLENIASHKFSFREALQKYGVINNGRER